MLGSIPKGAADILIYTIDWSSWLNAGDTINSSSWTVPAGMTDVTDSKTTTTTVVKISGGTVGSSYTITNTVTTSVSGETRTETFVLRVTH